MKDEQIDENVYESVEILDEEGVSVTIDDDALEMVEAEDFKQSPINTSRLKEGVKIHGLMPEHEKEALKMISDGTPLGEVADYFGIARSDIVYINSR